MGRHDYARASDVALVGQVSVKSSGAVEGYSTAQDTTIMGIVP